MKTKRSAILARHILCPFVLFTYLFILEFSFFGHQYYHFPLYLSYSFPLQGPNNLKMSDISNGNDNILDEDKMEMDPSLNSFMGTALSSLMDEWFPSKLPSELIKKVVGDSPVSGMPNTRDKATNEGPIKKIKPPKRVVYPGKSALQASSSSKKANVVKTTLIK